MAGGKLKLIGLTGPKCTGKSTVASYLVKHHGFKALHFSTPTKDMLRAVFGLEYASMSATEKEAGRPDLGGLSPRRVLQTFGVDYLRRVLGEDVLVEIARRKIKGRAGRYVFDDVRFNNEATMIKGLGGVIVGLKRKIKSPSKDSHSSEAGICPAFIDTTLNLNGKNANGQKFSNAVNHILKSFSLV